MKCGAQIGHSQAKNRGGVRPFPPWIRACIHKLNKEFVLFLKRKKLAEEEETKPHACKRVCPLAILDYSSNEKLFQQVSENGDWVLVPHSIIESFISGIPYFGVVATFGLETERKANIKNQKPDERFAEETDRKVMKPS